MTPESTPGPDTDRLAADKARQKAEAAPTSHGLATPDATPEPEESRIQADKARQQQAEHNDPKEAPSTQSKPPFDAESASGSQQGSQSQAQAKRKRSGSDNSEQDSDHPDSGPLVRRLRKEAKTQKPQKPHTPAENQEANAVASQNEKGESQPGDNAGQQTGDTMDTGEPQTHDEAGASPTTASKSWEPGLTRKGEPILGYRTIGGDGKGNPRGYQFVVQTGTKEKPQYDLQSGTEIGRRAVDGYLGMDKSKMTRLSEADKKYSRKDAKDYRGIKFVASKPLQTKLAGSNFRFPAAVCMASFANPEREDLIWRSTLRSVLGKTDADADIEDYYDENGLTKPWEVSPTRLRLKDDEDDDDSEGVKTRSRPDKRSTRKEAVTAESSNEDSGGEKTQSKEDLQAKVVDLESKLDRLLKLMEQQNSAKN